MLVGTIVFLFFTRESWPLGASTPKSPPGGFWVPRADMPNRYAISGGNVRVKRFMIFEVSAFESYVVRSM